MQVLKKEIFTGDKSGSVNITDLIEWLMKTGRKPTHNAMMKDNVRNLLHSHEWDRSFGERIKRLDKTRGKWLPLICVPTEDGQGVYVIDGWHRFWLLNKDCRKSKKPYVEFLAWVVTLEECQMFPAYPGIVQAATEGDA